MFSTPLTAPRPRAFFTLTAFTAAMVTLTGEGFAQLLNDFTFSAETGDYLARPKGSRRKQGAKS